MAWSSTSGQGRPKGSKNKATKALKDMILGALSDVGGQKYLERQAIENPVAFMSLIGKVLPTTLAGADGGPLRLTLEALVHASLVREAEEAKIIEHRAIALPKPEGKS
jgi:hypothetical protein